MLQEIGEALRTYSGIARRSRRDRPSDLSELAFDRRTETAGAAAYQGVQARDRSIESSHGGHQRVLALAISVETDHLCHGDIMNRGSDTRLTCNADRTRCI
jgi:hypothetical protein